MLLGWRHHRKEKGSTRRFHFFRHSFLTVFGGLGVARPVIPLQALATMYDRSRSSEAAPRSYRPKVQHRAILVAVAVLGAAALGGGAYVALSLQSRARAEEADKQLAIVRKLLEQQQPDAAERALTELTAKGIDTGEEGRWLLLRSLDEQGRSDEAAQLADAFLKDFPKSENRSGAERMQLLHEVAVKGVADTKVRARVESFLASNQSSPGTATELEAALGMKEAEGGDVASATVRFERLWASAPDHPATRQLGRAIGDANVRALHGGTGGAEFATHKLGRGEAIYNVAKKHTIPQELLLRVNGIADPKRLRQGQELKVPVVDWTLECDVAANALILRNKGKLFRFYDVRTGRDAGGTPKGTYRVLNKKQNPTWRPGDGRVYLPGDPNNELGTRWMSFEGDILGIHGTIREETIGHYASNGCIGMRRADVEELFDLITVGTSLTIVGEQDPTRHKILPKPDVPPPQGAVATSR